HGDWSTPSGMRCSSYLCENVASRGNTGSGSWSESRPRAEIAGLPSYLRDAETHRVVSSGPGRGARIAKTLHLPWPFRCRPHLLVHLGRSGTAQACRHSFSAFSPTDYSSNSAPAHAPLRLTVTLSVCCSSMQPRPCGEHPQI